MRSLPILFLILSRRLYWTARTLAAMALVVLTITSCTSKVNELDEIQKEETSQVKKSSCVGKECQVCVLPWGDVLPHGQILRNVFSKELASCDETCDGLSISLECDSGTLLKLNKSDRIPFKDQAYKSCFKKTCNCNFKDQIIAEGTVKDFFKTSSKTCDDLCEKKSLKCVSGKMIDPLGPNSAADLTKDYAYLSCNQLPCLKCTTPWNETVNSGTAVSAYKSSTLSCKDNCASATNKKDFNCYNGNFKEPGISNFPNKTCGLNPCRQCNLPCGKTINDGSNSYCFNIEKSANCGDTNCSSNSVRFYCTDANLTNSAGVAVNPANFTAYKFPSCTADDCRKCTAVWNTQYLSGTQFYGYKKPNVDCGKDCNTSENRNQFTCTSGTISPANNADFPNEKCSVSNCLPCTLPCGKQVNSGGHNTCYSLESPKICGDTCYQNSKEFYCFDGKVTDQNRIVTPPSVLETFTKASCVNSNAACAQCKTPEGKIVEDTKKVTFYRNNLVDCTESCLSQSNAVTLTCSDGQFGNKLLYPSFIYTTCKTKCDGIANGNRGIGRIEGAGGGAPVYMCRLPWSTEAVTHNTEITAYSKGSVPKGSSCQPYKKIITCNAYKGLWTGGAVYIYPTCYVEK